MNNKTKIMLGLSVLTAGTLAAGATGTFAWFTTNKSAKATYSKITASSTRGDLQIEMNGISEVATNSEKNYNYDSTTGKTAYKDITITGSTSSGMTDISSHDGLTFKKPNWVSASGNDEKVDTTAPFQKTASGTDYTKFWIKVTNAGNAKANVFLDSKTVITATTSSDTAQTNKNTALARWTRLAVVEATDSTTAPTDTSTGSLKWLVENSGTTGDTKTKYVKEATTEGALTLEAVSTDTHVLIGGGDTDKKFTTISDTTDTTATGYLFTLDADSSKYLICSVWCEGTENDNQNDAIGGSIDVTLNFVTNNSAA